MSSHTSLQVSAALRAELDKLLSRFETEATELVVTDQQRDQLVALVELLHKWNKAYNLTSVREPEQMLVKHILDSIVISPYLAEHKKLIDVGTGPGLPGLPLAIMNPDKQFVLLDSLGKRIRFIRQVVHSLGLSNVAPVQSRVERYQPEADSDGVAGFDAVLSRAFASMQDMLNWCHHLPKKGSGCFLALKGQYPEQEIKQLPDQFNITDIWSISVPGLEGERHLVKILPLA